MKSLCIRGTRRRPVLAVILIGGMASILAAFQCYRLEMEEIAGIFRNDARDRISLIHNTLDTHMLTLEALRSFFLSSEDVSRNGFQSFIGSFFSKSSGIQALEWIPRVELSERKRFTAAARRKGYRDFTIKERGPGNTLIPAKLRKEYFPVLYVEPFSENESALGFDLASNSERFKALDYARKNGRNTVTGRITLVQEAEEEFGYLTFLPVYNSPDSAARSALWRHKNLKGFILGVFRPKNIIEKSLVNLQPKGIDIYLLDMIVRESERFLYKHTSRFAPSEVTAPPVSQDAGWRQAVRTAASFILNALVPDRLTQKEAFRFCERNWQIVCVAGESYIRKHMTFTPWLVLLTGLVLTGFITFLIYRHIYESERIKKMVDVKTEALRQSKERLDLAMRSVGLGLWDWNIQTGEIFVDDRCVDNLEYSDSEVEFHLDFWMSLVHADDLPHMMKAVQAHLDGKIPIYYSEHRMRTRSGRWWWILHNGKVVEWDQDGNPLRAIGTHQDITMRKQVEQDLRRQVLILSQMSDGVVITDLNGTIEEWNPAAEKMFGYTRDEVIGKNTGILHRPEEAQILTQHMIDGMDRDGSWSGDINFIRKDGSEVICSTVVVPFLDENGNTIATIGVNRDISQRRKAEEQIKHLATHDILTNLPNRALFNDRLSMALAGSRRRNSITVFIFIDLDGFKEVNDSFGHDAGDELLRQVAQRLISCARESDTVSRYGGDEFVILLVDVSSKNAVRLIAATILKRLREPFFMDGKEVTISGSIGISFYPDHGSSPEELIKRADQAMYKVKKNGKNNYGFAGG